MYLFEGQTIMKTLYIAVAPFRKKAKDQEICSSKIIFKQILHGNFFYGFVFQTSYLNVCLSVMEM